MTNERGKQWAFGEPVRIKIHRYRIGRSEPSAYIKPAIVGICELLEWKYDTSPWSIGQLLDRYAGTEEVTR